MKITKQIVDTLLSINVKNRKPSEHRIEALARSMKNGWYVANNGQSIVVNKSWTWLLDGQHRLMAMRSANAYDFDIPIVEIDDNDAEKVFSTIDVVAGCRRTDQILSLEGGIPNTKSVCSMFNVMITLSGHRQASPSEIRMYYKKYEPIILKMKVYSTTALGGIHPNCNTWAGLFNAILITGKVDEFTDRFHNVLSNHISCICDQLLLNMIISARGKSGAQCVDMFYKTTKAFLHPELKVLKILDGEDTSLLLNKDFFG